jgi:CheY-like chemotaxis protein
MVVDDESLVRLALKRALEKQGHVVEEAEDGQQALERWNEFKPELVFLDVLMPRLSGPDLLKQITPGIKANTKVILMSAFTGDYNLEKAKSLGADLFINKTLASVFEVVRTGEALLG